MSRFEKEQENLVLGKNAGGSHKWYVEASISVCSVSVIRFSMTERQVALLRSTGLLCERAFSSPRWTMGKINNSSGTSHDHARLMKFCFG